MWKSLTLILVVNSSVVATEVTQYVDKIFGCYDFNDDGCLSKEEAIALHEDYLTDSVCKIPPPLSDSRSMCCDGRFGVAYSSYTGDIQIAQIGWGENEVIYNGNCYPYYSPGGWQTVLTLARY